jgi:hypothetical protein
MLPLVRARSPPSKVNTRPALSSQAAKKDNYIEQYAVKKFKLSES